PISPARAASPVLDLKRDDRFAVNLDAELRSDFVSVARVRRQKRNSIRSEIVYVYTVEQRFPFHFGGRTIKDDDSTVIIAAFEVTQLAKEIFCRAQILDARLAEICG